MQSAKINIMWEEDDNLFASMKDNYQSENEREFFEKILYKQQWECSLSNDLLMPAKNNEDGIYVVRIYFEEYIVGKKGREVDEEHVMNLSTALNLNLKKIGFEEDITLFEWLRRRDYAGVDYEHDFDYE